MVNLPRKKVGIVSCSGEELPEGTISRLATLKVLEELRREDTVTICLPLFLAGGEGDRAFARFYPTIAIDGCELGCASRGTEMYSSKPAATVVVRQVVAESSLGQPQGKRRLNHAGMQAVDATAARITSLVDELLAKPWNRREGSLIEVPSAPATPDPESKTAKDATCACGAGIPVQKALLDGEEVTLLALPLIFEQFREAGKAPSESVARELLQTVKVYNPVPADMDERYATMLLREYKAFCDKTHSS